MRAISTAIVFVLAVTGVVSAQAEPAKTAVRVPVVKSRTQDRTQETSRAMAVPNRFLPNCADLDLQPWQHLPCKDLGRHAEFVNPYAGDGVKHYESVRSVMRGLGALSGKQRSPDSLAVVEKTYADANGMDYARMRDIVPSDNNDPSVALKRLKASPALRSEVKATLALLDRQPSIDAFETELTGLNVDASKKLDGGEQMAYFEFTAALAQGYRFWTPASQGGAGGLEMAQALSSGGDVDLPPTSANPVAMRRWLKKVIRYVGADAIGALFGSVGGPVGAVAGGAGSTLGTVWTDVGPAFTGQTPTGHATYHDDGGSVPARDRTLAGR